jgi:hypothetical protein
MITLTSLLLAAVLSSPNPASSQQAPPPAPAATPAPTASSRPPSSASGSSSKGKNQPLPSFLIVGTVFDEKALSLTGVQVRIRRTGEKKFRWETYTNSRGEFAVRVPPGHDYEVVSHMKNYQDQNQTVDAKVEVQQRLSIQLVALAGTKTGAKP